MKNKWLINTYWTNVLYEGEFGLMQSGTELFWLMFVSHLWINSKIRKILKLKKSEINFLVWFSHDLWRSIYYWIFRRCRRRQSKLWVQGCCWIEDRHECVDNRSTFQNGTGFGRRLHICAEELSLRWVSLRGPRPIIVTTTSASLHL